MANEGSYLNLFDFFVEQNGMDIAHMTRRSLAIVKIQMEHQGMYVSPDTPDEVLDSKYKEFCEAVAKAKHDQDEEQEDEPSLPNSCDEVEEAIHEMPCRSSNELDAKGDEVVALPMPLTPAPPDLAQPPPVRVMSDKSFKPLQTPSRRLDSTRSTAVLQYPSPSSKLSSAKSVAFFAAPKQNSKARRTVDFSIGRGALVEHSVALSASACPTDDPPLEDVGIGDEAAALLATTLAEIMAATYGGTDESASQLQNRQVSSMPQEQKPTLDEKAAMDGMVAQAEEAAKIALAESTVYEYVPMKRQDAAPVDSAPKKRISSRRRSVPSRGYGSHGVAKIVVGGTHEDDFVSTLVLYIEKLQFGKVLCVKTAEAAVELCTARNGIHLVVFVIGSHLMNAVPTLHVLTSVVGPRVILIGGDRDDQSTTKIVADECIAQGAIYFATVPVDFNELRKHMQSVLDMPLKEDMTSEASELSDVSNVSTYKSGLSAPCIDDVVDSGAASATTVDESSSSKPTSWIGKGGKSLLLLAKKLSGRRNRLFDSAPPPQLRHAEVSKSKFSGLLSKKTSVSPEKPPSESPPTSKKHRLHTELKNR
ncbi:Aste57867_1237 [Aphanomyces stellatus]|uniref:Aste57867_1237 protein n=1 Tax=Aphanomyces stellatus TaxID=120398 RepID=A0A485K547_9STRA|nr:hypothetical protein As57867_001236 [Aphanomyces stellatus]VFT78456.1 Aste57867_1237 [Aphanomyces stellatus]